MLFCAPRTGSTALSNYLKDIEVPLAYEPFRDEKWENEPKDVILTLTRLFDRFQGVKHIETHLLATQNIELLQWCNRNEIKVVVLERQNYREMAFSHILAEITNIWSLEGEDIRTKILYDEITLPKIPLNQMKVWINLYKARWNQYGTQSWENPGLHYFVYYEEIFNMPLEKTRPVIKSLLDFMDIECPYYYKNLITTHFSAGKKQNLPAFYEKIPNWEEVKAYVYD